MNRKKVWFLCVISVFLLLASGCSNAIDTTFSCSAGTDRSVGLGIVTLSGSVSNSSGEVFYTWTAPAEITLSDASTANPSFEVSVELDEGDYEFELSVTDGSTNIVTDTVTITVEYVEQLLATAGTADEYFGHSISLSQDGTTALVGTELESNKVYILTKNLDGTWGETATLLDDSDSSDIYYFGNSVALSADGTSALIGALRNGSSFSYANIYSKDAEGAWTKLAKLTPDSITSGDSFGCSVAFSDDGTVALIGDYSNNSYTGAAYIFVKPTDGWKNTVETAKLTAPDPATSDYFGYSVALSGDGTHAIIGVPYDDDTEAGSGSAYIFSVDSTANWVTTDTETAKLNASDPVANDQFGWSVDISNNGTYALVGSAVAEAAYIFTNDGGWSQQAKLTSSTGASDDGFGKSVALSDNGTCAIIGASHYDEGVATDAGAAFIFSIDNAASWANATETAKLTAFDFVASDYFGNEVAISGDGSEAFIGASEDGNTNGDNAGSVYAFVLNY